MTTAIEGAALVKAQQLADALEAELHSLNVPQTVLRLYGLWVLIGRATGARTRFDVVLDGLFPEPADKALAAAVDRELARVRK
jgi:hypothetical protein